MAATQPETSSSGAASATKISQPEWQLPQKQVPEPELKMYNSLTRTKTPFVPKKGRTVTWYNCGPTVYDASHMGHARNYVTQDIIRRILRDYLGYDVHFVMNITDVDDKIIIKARHSYLIKQFRSQHPQLTKPLLATVQDAWSAYFAKNLERFAPPVPPQEQKDGLVDEANKARAGEAGFEEVSRLRQDAAWLKAASEKEPKFSMWFAALDKSRQAQVAAAMSLAAADTSSEAASNLIDASEDVLAAHLDKQFGSTVTDPSVFRDTAAYWEAEYFNDMKRLHVEPPTTLTRVSEYVPEIVTFVQQIIDRGYAYAEGLDQDKKNVWFDTRAFDGAKASDGSFEHSYAKLQPWSKGNRELLEEGEGSLSTSTAATAGKRAASDFALWKSSKPGEPAWPSPWGPGRPGWHIECSVMGSAVLGETMDIHSGGVDLMFPHHDNEIAQSEAHHGCRQWVNYFLHTGHLHIEGLKMSKSLKNFISIDEALERFTARQLRMSFLLQPWAGRMDFKQSALGEVKNAESAFNNFFVGVKAKVAQAKALGEAWSDGHHHYGEGERGLMATLETSQHAFREAMCDSFDTPKGMEILLDLVSKANIYEKSHEKRSDVNIGVLTAVARYVGDMLKMLGLGEGGALSASQEIGWGTADESMDGAGAANKEELLMPYLQALSNFRDAVRNLARSSAPASEYLKLSDALRDNDLVDLGISLEDTEDGKALVKLVPAAQLQAARREKEAAAAEKAARKAQAAEQARLKRLENLEKGRTAPEQMFRTEEYSEWDERGLPVKDKEGAELAKKRRKNLDKDYEKQTKLHKEFLEAREKGEIQ
ncbi:Cysteinyl-tRNA synthetase/mycothiol ligase [Kalmanozyma brasiliensis GHG001]|uniref:cysteine--tRNA ligase n=1 Tax=Kalmanozyma brasiliensis (strain GHG001) TaxID=1365824 RepID=V5EU47_KALBG|nr:Cysteinyl-tRNA synthetase/mycothiol ligase [Kalmanozyma brasiliensis GHG001]EST05579.1 Cysteinyl-tRNA synthetase/mycothiol ligase [Kalmanozyma brasiliensis GHG001]